MSDYRFPVWGDEGQPKYLVILYVEYLKLRLHFLSAKDCPDEAVSDVVDRFVVSSSVWPPQDEDDAKDAVRVVSIKRLGEEDVSSEDD